MALNPQMLLCFTSLIGIIPAILIMYYLLRSYERFIKDNKLYGFLAGGMVIGMIAYALHALVDQQVTSSLDLAIMIFIIGFAAFEELAKYVILYFKRFLGKFETTYHGLAMGLGFGATSIIGFAYQAFLLDPDVVEKNPIIVPTAIILAVAYVSLHATTGCLIGYGSAKKIKWRLLGHATLIHIVFNSVLFWFWWSDLLPRFVISFLLAGIGIWGLNYIRLEILTGSLPGSLARSRRREMRKNRRTKGSKMIKGKGKVSWRSKVASNDSEE